MATETDLKVFPSLSTETLHSICNSLNQRDVASFRRSARKYAGVGYEYLFRHYKIRLRFSREYFKLLRDLSTNISACRGIGTLEFYGMESDFHGGIDGLRGKDGNVKRTFPKEELQASLKRLPSLDTIKFRTLSYAFGESSGNLRPATCVVHQMEHLIRDVQSCSDLNLKHLGFQDFFQSSSISSSLKASIVPEEKLQISFSATCLTRLDLILQPLNHRYNVEQVIAFADSLQSTPNLEELVLDFGSQEPDGTNRMVDGRAICFDSICQANLGHLRKVAFSHGSVSQQNMLAFFEHHTSLTDIRLRSVHLEEGDWAILLNEMAYILPDISTLAISGPMRSTTSTSGIISVCGEHLSMCANSNVVQKLPTSITYESRSRSKRSRISDEMEQLVRREEGRECCPCETCGMLLD